MAKHAAQRHGKPVKKIKAAGKQRAAAGTRPLRAPAPKSAARPERSPAPARKKSLPAGTKPKAQAAGLRRPAGKRRPAAIPAKTKRPVKRAQRVAPPVASDRFQEQLSSRAHEKGALIPLLQAAQDIYGYIPEHAILRIHEAVGVPVAEIYGVITFYSQFRLKPLGKYLIKMCDGTACHVNGSERIAVAIEDELQLGASDTTADGLFTLQKVACLGCCSLSPVIMINDETYGRLNPKKIQQLLKEYKAKACNPQDA